MSLPDPESERDRSARNGGAVEGAAEVAAGDATCATAAAREAAGTRDEAGRWIDAVYRVRCAVAWSARP